VRARHRPTLILCNIWGSYNLGCCFYSGKGTAQDLNEAFLQFRKAADLGLDVAQCADRFLWCKFVTFGAGTASASACATASGASATLPLPWTGTTLFKPQTRFKTLGLGQLSRCGGSRHGQG
jgi:TPR repeat protein